MMRTDNCVGPGLGVNTITGAGNPPVSSALLSWPRAPDRECRGAARAEGLGDSHDVAAHGGDLK